MKFEELKKQYGEFQLPAVNVVVEGKSFGDNGKGMVLSDVHIELSSREEASQAVFRIYNCIDEDTGEYRIAALKPYILLGSAIVVELGYLAKMTEVFRGFIACVRFINEDYGPSVEVTAMDVKGIMMSGACARMLKSTAYSDAVQEIFDKPPYQEMRSRNIIKKLEIEATPDKQRQSGARTRPIDMVCESDYDFLVKAARKFHFEFFVDKGVVHFRKAKPEQKPQGSIGPGEGLIAYRIGYDIRSMVRQVEVRSMDDGTGSVLSGKKKFQNKISMGNKAGALLSETEKVCIDAAVSDLPSAIDRAKDLMDQMAERYGSLDGECVGIPDISPGRYLEIVGLSEPADNTFYVTEVEHILDTSRGYRTRIRGTASSQKGRTY